jgi:hypothetical protein
MTQLKEFKDLQGIVKKVLEQKPETRDNDRKLEIEIWFKFAKLYPGIQFSELYLSGKLPLADTITRAGRKLKEKFPNLRGEHWAERKSEEQKWRNEM